MTGPEFIVVRDHKGDHAVARRVIGRDAHYQIICRTGRSSENAVQVRDAMARDSNVDWVRVGQLEEQIAELMAKAKNKEPKS